MNILKWVKKMNFDMVFTQGSIQNLAYIKALLIKREVSLFNFQKQQGENNEEKH